LIKLRVPGLDPLRVSGYNGIGQVPVYRAKLLHAYEKLPMSRAFKVTTLEGSLFVARLDDSVERRRDHLSQADLARRLPSAWAARSR
jgi:hypothetical protein